MLITNSYQKLFLSGTWNSFELWKSQTNESFYAVPNLVANLWIKLNFCFFPIDEGISGYRDDSLETVKRNRDQYGLPLKILSYQDLYGWTMDQIVSTVGRKNNCTFCGVFRRQALDRGAMQLGVNKIVTGKGTFGCSVEFYFN